MRRMKIMNRVKNFEDISVMCRICLTQSDDMISIDNKLDDSEDSPLILDALEKIVSVKIIEDINYPREICHLCHGNIRILYDLKHLFTKSQKILEKYVSSLESEDFFQSLESLSPEHDFDYYKDENSKISIDDGDSIDPIQSPTTKVDSLEIDEHNLLEHDVPTKTIKLTVGAQGQKNVQVKWLEGNKFIIEKGKDIPKVGHKCNYCNKRFLTKEKLTSHFDFCKNNVVFKCDFCESKFSSLSRKQNHMKLRHASSNVREIKCEICDMTFKNHNARSYHKLTRHNTEGKKFKCEICGKAFYIKNSLNQHMECHSRDVSKVVCPICGKGFHYRGGLFYHMKIHRNERNYICTFCNRRFLTMASLKRHTRIHTGERPYSCSLCSKTFCSVGEVKTHERRHTGQKPFPCKYCSKCFISPYNLKLHVSSHAGSQPCDFCSKSFLNNEALKYHLDIKHNIREKKNKIEQIV